MNTNAIIPATAAAVMGLLVFGGPVRAAEASQTFVLHAGWNAIQLEVTPEPNDVESVFKPVTDRGTLRGVWRSNEDTPVTQFVQNPSTLLPKSDSWLTWFPPAYGRSVLKTLHAVHGGQCYLVEIEPGSADVTLQLTGRPVIRPLQWKAGKYSLTGLCVDPSNSPTFATFFAPSAAHGTPDVRRLNPQTGNWVAVTPQTPVVRGTAYWIKAQAPSSYQGPVSVEVEGRGLLDFGSAVLERPLTLRNQCAETVQFTIKNLAASPAGALALSVYDEWSPTGSPNLFQWRELSGAGLTIPVAAGLEQRVRIAIRRNDMAGLGVDNPFASLMEIRSGKGTIHTVAARAAGFSAAADPGRWAGLWVGHARIFQVEQVTAGQTGLKDTASEASFRLILHVDATGHAKLLRECILMWLNGTTNSAGDVTDPGRMLVFADGEAIDAWKSSHASVAARLTGVSQRANGQMVGQRLSSVAFSFADPRPMTGSFGTGTLATTVAVGPSDDLNPFRHRYHPDHQQGLSIGRNISLNFSAQTGDGGERAPDVATGDAELSGTYQETITGIYRAGVGIRGEFRLRRVLGKADLYE